MNIKNIIGGFKLKCCKTLVLRERLGKADIGILKVAFMVAALDGEVTDAEYDAFAALAKKCRGYTPESAAAALDEAMRSAGYLLLVAKRLKTPALVKAFVAEAKKALPDGFAYCTLDYVRRAFVTWIAVGMSDGDYSDRERACIEALRKAFAELAIKRVDEEDERWRALSPAFRVAYENGRRATLVGKDFVARVEDLAAKFGDTAAATKELEKLVAAKA